MKYALTFAISLVACATAAMAKDTKPYTQNVAIVVYDGVEVLDFAGPAEVFQVAGNIGANGGEKAFNVFTVSRGKTPIVSQSFLHVVPNYSIETSPRPDILILPGGSADSVTSDPTWMVWVQKAGRESDQVLTVCTGAFIAGKVGLLDGIEATTFYRSVPSLAEQFPKSRVEPGRRFIDSGKLITTAGVSAGIDGSLHLVARLLGRYVADRTAEYMEYKWGPDSYLSAQYKELNPRLDLRGQRRQQASIARREGNADTAITMYRELLKDNGTDAATWLELARTLHRLKQYRDAVAANREAAKGAAERGEALYNLACEYALLGELEEAIAAATKAVEAGFRMKGMFAGDPDLQPIRNDPRFKALVATL